MIDDNSKLTKKNNEYRNLVSEYDLNYNELGKDFRSLQKTVELKDK